MKSIKRPTTILSRISALAFAAFCLSPADGTEPLQIVRGADELYWVPTLEQALEMAKVTGKPIFLMGYSLVDSRSTYTQIDKTYCSSVF